MDAFDYGLKKLECGGCSVFLPSAVDMATKFRNTLTDEIQRKNSWLVAPKIAEEVSRCMINNGVGFGLIMYEASKALAYCERCWNFHCNKCTGCMNHGG